MFAGRGVWFCIRHERNFRVHMAVAAYVLLLAPYFSLSRGEWAALLAVVALVLAAEAVNTAVEQVVNLASPRRRTRARVAKDVAAGAVFLCAAGGLAAGLFLVLRPEAFAAMQADFLRCPWKPALLAASLPLAVWFVICGGRPRRRPKK